MRLTRSFAMASITSTNYCPDSLIFNYACCQAFVNINLLTQRHCTVFYVRVGLTQACSNNINKQEHNKSYKYKREEGSITEERRRQSCHPLAIHLPALANVSYG